MHTLRLPSSVQSARDYLYHFYNTEDYSLCQVRDTEKAEDAAELSALERGVEPNVAMRELMAGDPLAFTTEAFGRDRQLSKAMLPPDVRSSESSGGLS
jgi:hypothetical protein